MSSPEDIFTYIQDYRYVDENTRCASVGVVRCPESSMHLGWNEFGKRRLIIAIPGEPVWDLPVTGLTYDEPRQSDDEALILLGLGRAYDNEGRYNPPRCYLLVLNIFTRSDYKQMSKMLPT